MAGICPPWAGSCRRGRKGSSPKGADIFLLVIGGSGSWQKLTLVFWLLVGKRGGCRSSPRGHVAATSGMEIAIAPSAVPRQQPNRCSANYKMLLCWMKITLLSIQRTDNGLFSSPNTGKKVCKHRTRGLLFPSYNGDGATRQLSSPPSSSETGK